MVAYLPFLELFGEVLRKVFVIQQMTESSGTLLAERDVTIITLKFGIDEPASFCADFVGQTKCAEFFAAVDN